MSLKRFNARRDANEPRLVELARSLGAKMWRLDTPVDWLMLWRQTWYPVEIKDEGGTLTPSQREFMETAMNAGGDFLLWRTEADVLACLAPENVISYREREG